MKEKILIVLEILKGNAIVIQRRDENAITVDCGKNITKDFAKRSTLTAYLQLS